MPRGLSSDQLNKIYVCPSRVKPQFEKRTCKTDRGTITFYVISNTSIDLTCMTTVMGEHGIVLQPTLPPVEGGIPRGE